MNKIDLQEKSTPRVSRRPWIVLKNLNIEERQAMVKKDPRFAQMICRCEQISEGEIIDAIHRNCGATTVKGVKKRVRPGTGRCQGGFCGPKIMDILARETGMKLEDITQDKEGSYILIGDTKQCQSGE